MENQALLLILYSWLLFLNIGCMVMLYKSTRVRYYLQMIILWGLAIVNLSVAAVFSEQSPTIQLLSFISAFGYYFYLSYIFNDLLDLKLSIKKFVFFHFLSSTLSSILISQGVENSILIALPITFTTGLPCIYVSLKAIFQKKLLYSSAIFGLTLAVLFQGIHTISYAFIYTNLNLVLIGFTVGVALALALSLFGTGVIIEKVTREKVELELSLAYKAQLTNSAKYAALGEVAAGIAHEINSPLTIFSLALRYLSTSIDKDKIDIELLKKSIAKMEKTVVRIAAIVTGMKNLSRESSGEDLTEVSLNEVIEDVINIVESKFESKAIEIKINRDEFDFSALVDRVQLSQVFMNLFNNAYDAIENLDEKWIKLEVQRKLDHDLIKVTDSGHGIPEEIRSKIFQPFFTTKAVGQGTGIGLGISRAILEKHGGELVLETTSENTCFIIKLAKKSNSKA